MANLVKVKNYGILFFVFVSILSLIIYKTKIFESDYDECKFWAPDSTLLYSDFWQKKNKKGEKYIAYIYTGIVFEEISTGKYIARAAIDRSKSYFNKEKYSEYSLNHEKYHANITALIVRELNEYLEQYEYINNMQLRKIKEKFLKKRRELQIQYDFETKNGTDEAMQYYWEYKIDSLYYSRDGVESKDIFSGISGFFPTQPDINTHKDSFNLTKTYELLKYNMLFKFTTYYDEIIDTPIDSNYLVSLFSKNTSYFVFNDYFKNNKYFLNVEYHDSVYNQKFVEKNIVDYPYYYHIVVRYPYPCKNDTLYNKMMTQFFNSIVIENQIDFWEEQIASTKINNPIELFTGSKNTEEPHYYLVTRKFSTFSLFFHRPIIKNNHLIIPFSTPDVNIKDIEDIIFIVNNEKIFSKEPDSTNQIIVLNNQEHNIDKISKLQFGYTLKSDSINNHYYLWGTVLDF